MIQLILHRLLPFTLLALLVAGCAAPSTEPDPRPTETGRDRIEPAPVAEGPDVLLRRAQRADAATAASLRLQAAALLLDADEAEAAADILRQIDPDRLDEPDYSRHHLLAAVLELDRNEDADAALERLAAARALQASDDLQRAAELRARALDRLDRPLAAVRARVQLQSLLQDETRTDQNPLIWALLQRVPEPGQRAAAPALDDHPLLRGWLELAALARRPWPTLEDQQAAVIGWEQTHPDHPAVAAPPELLAELPVAIAEQPRHVALLLPLSGPLGSAGEAVLNGYMASHYHALAHDGFSPRIQVHDTARMDPLDAYRMAVDDGVQLVIGPLDRGAVESLASEGSLPVPVLALNTVPALRTDGQLMQFGLLPEDEGVQLAEGVYREGHRRVLVLSSDASWADRLRDHFQQRFEQLGGEVVRRERFATAREIGDGIAASLLLDESQQRVREMRRVLATNLEFEPRRRQDLDAVVLASDPGGARSIKPTLAYHFAGDLPVYASSHMYQGTPEQRVSSDLDGIRFLGMPWRLGHWPVREAVESAWSGADGSSASFYAMGVDAWQLQARLPLLATRGGFYAGATGELRLDGDGRLQRRLDWALLQRGRPVPVDWLQTPLLGIR